MNRVLCSLVALFLVCGCEQADIRHGFKPGEVEVISNAKVYHLADGLFIEKPGKAYFLVDASVANYRVTPTGLDVQLADGKGGPHSLSSQAGKVVSCTVPVSGEGLDTTQFDVEDSALAELLAKHSPATQRSDFDSLKE